MLHWDVKTRRKHKWQTLTVALPYTLHYLLLTIRYNTIKYNAVQCNEMKCNTIQYNTMQCNAMQCNAVQCNAMQCNAMQCSAMQCNAVQCNAIQYNTIQYNTLLHDQLIQTGYQEIWLVKSRSVNPHTAREIPYKPGLSRANVCWICLPHKHDR